MGGLAGMIVVGQKVRAAFDYGLIAIGIVGMVVGLNYLIVNMVQSQIWLMGIL